VVFTKQKDLIFMVWMMDFGPCGNMESTAAPEALVDFLNPIAWV